MNKSVVGENEIEIGVADEETGRDEPTFSTAFCPCDHLTEATPPLALELYIWQDKGSMLTRGASRFSTECMDGDAALSWVTGWTADIRQLV